MLASAAVAIGGIGLFLIGMLILTDGLKSLIGNSQRRLLAGFTNSPLSGAMTGALTTAVIQSSSATTVTAVGFVGAGLLTFPQALGVIFGANVGTTVTGWMVALIGFKLHLGTLLFPVLLLAVLIKLFGRARTAQAGWALAGFCLIFIGLDAMQDGMKLFEGMVTPSDFPADTLFGRLLLVAIGVVITLVTQSSSAGVATAMVALGSGAITLEQAAAMVIGMNVGTTFSAMLATVGGSAAMRQTGVAHVVFNLLAGAMAFALLTPFGVLAGPLLETGEPGSQQLALVIFHTAFNFLGALVFLPFTRQFARLILAVVPEDSANLARHLDSGLLKTPAAATDALAGTLGACCYKLLELLRADLAGVPERRAALELGMVGEAIGKAESYAADLQLHLDPASDHSRFVAAMHALDHLRRLYQRAGQNARIQAIIRDEALQDMRHEFIAGLTVFTRDRDTGKAEADFDVLRRKLRAERRAQRKAATLDAALRHLKVEDAIARIDGTRWLHRCAYHVWRIAHHIGASVATDPVPAAESPEKTAALEAEFD